MNNGGKIGVGGVTGGKSTLEDDGLQLSFFERLIAPLSPKQFFDHFWCQKGLFIKNIFDASNKNAKKN